MKPLKTTFTHFVLIGSGTYKFW